MALAEREQAEPEKPKEKTPEKMEKPTPVEPVAPVKTEEPKPEQTVAAPVAPTPVPAPVPVITPAEMETKLLARVTVTENELRDLMQQRAQHVQDFLLKTEKVTAERLFIISPKPIDENYKGESKVNLLLN